MSEHFLEEQLRRIREMSEQIARVRNHQAQVSQEVARDRALIKRSPLHEVRDFRSPSSIDENPATANDHAGRPARASARARRK